MSGGIESPSGSSYANSGLNRFGGIPAYNPDPYRPPTFSSPNLPSMRASIGTTGGGSTGGVGGMGGFGEGGAIGPPAASTNPGLSNSITTGLVGLMLGPMAATAVNGLLGGGPGASSGGTSSAAGTVGGDAAPAGVGIGEGIGGVSGDGGGGGGGSK